MAEWNPRANEIFVQAIQLEDAAERMQFVEEACGTDAALREAVETLLKAHDQAGEFLNQPAAGLTADEAAPQATASYTASEAPGTLIAGKYKLLQQIGEGGMGSVWMADQTEPVKRRVAVKLIRTDRGSTKTILARFEAERQAIALMDHPHIAKLLDAGTTETQAPYFVMELVKGVPLTEFCDQHKLSIPDRLNLFMQICSAVQHAHQKGIIHRDLKPSNILVELHDDKPVPKVIDFGLAKATSGIQLTENTLFTGFGTVAGTPLYMAPEQANFNAVDIDTRADIYALGVILYELLTGTTPISRETIKKAALEEMMKLIREQEAPTPSSRLSSSESTPTVAANRHTEPARLSRMLKGELDWIVMKALSKERERRYETANGFARDIERFLNQEPVSAGPVSAGYRFRKFVKRNKGKVVAVGLVMGALMLGMIGTTIGLLEANHARLAEAERAEGERLAKLDAQEKEKLAVAAAAKERVARLEEERERKFAQAIASFVKDDFLALTSVEGQSRFAGEGLNRSTTLLELLNRAAGKLKERKDLDPRIEAELCWIVGVNYRGTGEVAKGIPFLERAVTLREQKLGLKHEDTIYAQNSLAVSYAEAGQLEKSSQVYKKILNLKLGLDHPLTLACMNGLAVNFMETDQLDKALPLLEETLNLRKAKLGVDHNKTLESMNNLAVGYRNTGQLDKALHLAEGALQLKQTKQGAEYSSTLTSKQLLAALYMESGKLDKGLSMLEEIYTIQKNTLETDHPDTLHSMNYLADGYRQAGQLDKALQLFEKTLKLRQIKLGFDHTDTITTMNSLATTYIATGQPELALPLLTEALKLMKSKRGLNNSHTLTAMNNLACCYYELKRLDQSIPLFEVLLIHREKKYGRKDLNTMRTIANLGINYFEAGRLKDAIPLLEEVHSASKTQPRFREHVELLIAAYFKFGESVKYKNLLDEALAGIRQSFPKDSQQLAGQLASIGFKLYQAHSYPDAETLLRECLTIREKTQPDTWSTFNTQSMLGAALLGQKKYADAEPLLLNGYEGMKAREKTIPPQGKNRLPEALDRLIQFYTETNKPDEVKKWQAEKAKLPKAMEKKN